MNYLTIPNLKRTVHAIQIVELTDFDNENMTLSVSDDTRVVLIIIIRTYNDQNTNYRVTSVTTFKTSITGRYTILQSTSLGLEAIISVYYTF